MASFLRVLIVLAAAAVWLGAPGCAFYTPEPYYSGYYAYPYDNPYYGYYPSYPYDYPYYYPSPFGFSFYYGGGHGHRH